jgi:hypothetical protein
MDCREVELLYDLIEKKRKEMAQAAKNNTKH